MSISSKIIVLTAPLVFLAFEGVANADYGTDGTTCGFANLEDAVNDAGPGGIVFVESGLNTMAAEADITFDVTLQGSDASCSALASGDSTLQFNGIDGRLLRISNGAFVQLERITLSDGDTLNDGGLVKIDGVSTLWAHDSAFESGTAAGDGGCISAVQSDVFLIDSEVSGCLSYGDGGAAWLNQGSIFVSTGSVVRDGTSVSGLGGNIAAEGATVTVWGDLHGGFAGDSGGGIAATRSSGISADVYVYGDVFDNLATNSGGGAYVEGVESTLTVLAQGSMYDNEASVGGGLLGELGVVVRVEGDGSVSGNTADNGGGIALTNSELELADNATISDNVASLNGGGITAVFSTITGDSGGSGSRIRIDDNRAEATGGNSQGGGGIRLKASSMTATGVTLFGNDASTGRGGGVLAIQGSDMELTNGSIELSAAGEGGGIYAKDSELVLLGDTATCDPNTLQVDRYCSQVFFNIASTVASGAGRGGGISLVGTSTLDAQRSMIGYNIALADAEQIAVDGAQVTATLRNAAVVSHPEYIAAFGGGAAIDVRAGTLDLRSSTVAGHDVGLNFAAGSVGVMHRNIVADNVTGAALGAPVTGNCNVSQTAAESPTGVGNDDGVVSFVLTARSTYEISSASTLAHDQCAAGPSLDIDGRPRPVGAWDRGMYEVQ